MEPMEQQAHRGPLEQMELTVLTELTVQQAPKAQQV